MIFRHAGYKLLTTVSIIWENKWRTITFTAYWAKHADNINRWRSSGLCLATAKDKAPWNAKLHKAEKGPPLPSSQDFVFLQLIPGEIAPKPSCTLVHRANEMPELGYKQIAKWNLSSMAVWQCHTTPHPFWFVWSVMKGPSEDWEDGRLLLDKGRKQRARRREKMSLSAYPKTVTISRLSINWHPL